MIAALGGHAEARDMPWLPGATVALSRDPLGSTGASQPQKESPDTNAEENEAPPANSGQSSGSKYYKPYPDIYADACYKAEDHDAADLCAQWRAALAAEKASEAAVLGNYIAGGGALLSFFSIVLVVIALQQTRRANKIASDAYIADRRPWVPPDLEPGPITWQDGACMVGLGFQLRNTGATPALKVRFALQVHLWDASKDWSAEQIRFANHAKSNADRGFGFTIFPGDDNTKTIFRHKCVTYTNSVGEQRNAVPEANFASGVSELVLIGCIIYNGTLSEEVFETGFIRTIRRVTPDSPMTPQGAMSLIRPSDGKIPRTELRLTGWLVDGRVT